MKPIKTWILVADAAQARIFENQGPGKGLHELPGEAVSQTIPPTRDLGTDRPGRTHGSSGSERHSMAPRADWHEQTKENFAKALGTHLNDAHINQSFDRLILVAPPKTLGQLRDTLTTQTANVVTAEINKDLTTHTQEDIEKHVAEFAAI